MTKDALVQIELLSKVVQSLFEVKRLNNNAMLATKHAILIALVSSSLTASMRQKT
jgi:hypothetical protein